MFAGTFAILTPNTYEYRILKVSIALSMVALTWLFPNLLRLKFAREKDKGILFFGLLVCVWSVLDLDYGYFAPTIYADPMGAIVGNKIPKPKLYKSKTVRLAIHVLISFQNPLCYLFPFVLNNTIHYLRAFLLPI